MRYKSFVLQKFVNSCIRGGNKSKSAKFFTNILSFLKKTNNNKTPFGNILNILRLVKPTVLFIKIKRGSKPFYLPKLLTIENQYKQGIIWIIKFSQQNKTSNFYKNLEEEIALILQGKGKSIEEKNRIYSLLIDGRPYLYLLKWY